jgi:hypothetical protein
MLGLLKLHLSHSGIVIFDMHLMFFISLSSVVSQVVSWQLMAIAAYTKPCLVFKRIDIKK